MQTPADTPDARGRLQVVELETAGRRVGLEVRIVRQIVRAPPVTPLPGAPARIEGVADLGGMLVPVADLALLLTGEACPQASRLVVADLGGLALGLRVERALDVATADGAELEPPPPGSAAAPLVRLWIRRRDAAPLPVLSPEALLAAVSGEPPGALSSNRDAGAQHPARTADEPSR